MANFVSHVGANLMEQEQRKTAILKAEKDLEKIQGTTPFVRAYVAQNALAGHSIPVGKGEIDLLHALGVINDAEADKAISPGMERAIPKNKGVEFGSLLHQAAAEIIFSQIRVPDSTLPALHDDAMQAINALKTEAIDDISSEFTNCEPGHCSPELESMGLRFRGKFDGERLGRRRLEIWGEDGCLGRAEQSRTSYARGGHGGSRLQEVTAGVRHWL